MISKFGGIFWSLLKKNVVNLKSNEGQVRITLLKSEKKAVTKDEN